MRREISVVLQPKILLISAAALVVIFLAFSFSPQEVQRAEEVYEITRRVFLDVDIDKQHVGRITIGLYGQIVPKTVGEFGKAANGEVLHYKGTPFHRIIPGFMIQGGDIVSGDGRGKQSIYGGTFRNENFMMKHSLAGVVSMVNSGPDSNGSQFFITTVKAYWLDGEHVVFGKVIDGMDAVYAIEGGAGTCNHCGFWGDTQEQVGRRESSSNNMMNRSSSIVSGLLISSKNMLIFFGVRCFCAMFVKSYH